MLRKLTELLGIEDVDRNKNLDAEEKIYAKLSAGGTKAKHSHGEKETPNKSASKAKKSDESTDEKPKKTTTRKKKEE